MDGSTGFRDDLCARPSRALTRRRWRADAAHVGSPPPFALLTATATLDRNPWMMPDQPPTPSRLNRSDRVRLDGSLGEGGGQILRTALSLAMVTGRPFTIDRIRANRAQPGLRPQHCAAVRAAARICSAQVQGDVVGSRHLSFEPGEVVAEDLAVDIKTAGSCTLVLQTLHLPIALRATTPVTIQFRGGTFNPMAPSALDLIESWAPMMGRLGLPTELELDGAGFYPRGGGGLAMRIEPGGRPRPLDLLERGPLPRVDLVAGSCRLPDHVVERLLDRASDRLAGLPTIRRPESWDGPAPGAALCIVARYAGIVCSYAALGAPGKPAELVADEACDRFLADHALAGAVEPHLADQLLLPLALASGPSSYTVTHVTEHLRTNSRTIEPFLDRRITIHEPSEQDGEPGRVTIA